MRLGALTLIAITALLMAPAADALTTFYGTVGPSQTIVLTGASGKVVRRASAGSKTFVIRDRSAAHNFHLYGPGVDRRTGVGFIGRRRWSPVILSPGRYTIVCDRHPLTMFKHFRVF